MARLYQAHTKPEPPRWTVGLTRLDSLQPGDKFITAGGRLGHVLLPLDSSGKVCIAVPSIDFEGPAYAGTLVRRDS